MCRRLDKQKCTTTCCYYSQDRCVRLYRDSKTASTIAISVVHSKCTKVVKISCWSFCWRRKYFRIFVANRVDYCNAVLYGTFTAVTRRLRTIQQLRHAGGGEVMWSVTLQRLGVRTLQLNSTCCIRYPA